MGFDDAYKMSCHAVFTDDRGRVLQLRQTYTDTSWGLPGGSAEPGETIHETLARECREELGVDVANPVLTGVYYHSRFNSYAFVFKCDPLGDAEIALSGEHSEFRYFELEELGDVQRVRVRDCLDYAGIVVSRKF